MKEASSAGHSHVLTPSPWTGRLVLVINSTPHEQHKIFVILMALMGCLPDTEIVSSFPLACSTHPNLK